MKIKIIKWFMLNFPSIVRDMENISHNYDRQNLNIWHMEGSVWTHTCMVYNSVPDNSSVELLLCALLHDIGKPTSFQRNDEKKKTSFKGHEPISAFLSIDILFRFEKDFNLTLDKVLIFKVISMHTFLFNKSQEYLNENLSFKLEEKTIHLLEDLREADTKGAFRDSENNTMSISRDLKDKEIVEKEHKALFLIGLPCSGKDAYLTSTNFDSSYTVISRDDILTYTVTGNTYNEKFNNADQKKIDQLLEEYINLSIKNNQNVLFNMTNLSEGKRNKRINKLNGKYNVKAVVFLPKMSTIVNRNENRTGKYISESVYIEMMKSFTIPTYAMFDEIEWVISE